MRKCNICGKTISDFTERCPYCNNSDCKSLNSDNVAIIKPKHTNKKRDILLWINIAFILVVSFIPSWYSSKMTPAALLMLLMRLALTVACIIYSIFIIKKYKVVDVQNNKKSFIISLIISALITIVGIGRELLFSWKYGTDYFVYHAEHLIIHTISSLIGGILFFCLVSDLFCIFGKQIKSEKHIDKNEV